MSEQSFPFTHPEQEESIPFNCVDTPHDVFFKDSIQRDNIARDFFKAYLPSEIYNALDLDTLQLVDKSYLDPELRALASDILYRCQIKGHDAYIPTLIFSKLTPTKDPHMAFRLLQYTLRLMDNYLKEGHKRLPIVLPLCLYHTQPSPYPYSVDIYDEFEDAEFARKFVFKPFKLIDLTTMSLDTLQQHGEAGLMEALLQAGGNGSLKDIKQASLSQEELMQVFASTYPHTGEGVKRCMQQLKQRSIEKTNRALTRIMEEKNYTDCEIETLLKKYWALTEEEVALIVEKRQLPSHFTL